MWTKLTIIVIQILCIVLEVTILSMLTSSLKETGVTKNKYFIIFQVIGWPNILFGALILWKNKCPFLTSYILVEIGLLAIFFAFLFDIRSSGKLEAVAARS